MTGQHPEPHYRPSNHHEHAHQPQRRRGVNPWLVVAVLLVALVAAGVWVGWRGVEARKVKTAPKVVIGSVGVFFPSGEKYERVSRPVYEGQTQVEAAMSGLVAGPTPDEIKKGLGTDIPFGTKVDSVKLEGDAAKGKERATVDLSDSFVEATSRDAGDAKREFESRLDQVGYTMAQFKQVSASEVKSGGKTLAVPTVAQIEKPTQPEPATSEPVAAPSKSAPSASPASASGAVPAASKSGSGMSITQAQHRLVTLKYLPSEGVTGKNDYRTQQAVMAFQAWQGLQRDGTIGPATSAALGTAQAPAPKAVPEGTGRNAQVYRDKGVALFVQDGALVRAVHVSTGKPGYATPAGTFAVYQKELKHWSTQYNCWLPYASFFNGGYAFHQYEEIPPYPGSHGCCRVPAPEAPWVYQFLVMKTPVHVY